MEGLLILVVVAFVAYVILRSVGRKHARPVKHDVFVCSGCGTQDRHNNRTLGAWQRGSRSFFCRQCHEKWRQQQVAQPSGAGCLGASLLLLAVPVGLLSGWIFIP